MDRPGIFAAAAIVIIGGLAIRAVSTASQPYAPSFAAQIEPLPLMAQAHGLPAQRTTDFSHVFVAPVALTAP